MNDTETLRIGPQQQRSLAPIVHGAMYGFLPGAVLGASAIVGILVWSAVQAYGDANPGFGASEVAESLPILAFAAIVGGFYGLVVGALAGLGAVIEPERGMRRRCAVAGITVLVGILTTALLASGSGDLSWLVGPAPVYLVAMTAVAWWLAPRLDGRGRPGAV